MVLKLLKGKQQNVKEINIIKNNVFTITQCVHCLLNVRRTWFNTGSNVSMYIHLCWLTCHQNLQNLMVLCM